MSTTRPTANDQDHIVSAAFWVRAPGTGEIRTATLPPPGPDEVQVRTLYSGVSRGTETLVFRGGVPESQATAMRAPFQEGEFPGPVKYGYLNVGMVERGPAALLGRPVFCLYPHQTRYVVPAAAVTPVPEGVPPGRAILAGTVETAVNALWDAAPLVGDRIAVVGAGMVGCAVAALLGRFPGVRVELVDVDPARAAIAEALGVGFALPQQAAGECDLVVHASASEAGLARCLELAGFEAEIVELSWYGDRPVAVPLGEAFHSRRLVLRCSQVGAVSPARRARRGHADRMALALELLADPAFDALISDEIHFDELPALLPRLARAADTRSAAALFGADARSAAAPFGAEETSSGADTRSAVAPLGADARSAAAPFGAEGASPAADTHSAAASLGADARSAAAPLGAAGAPLGAEETSSGADTHSAAAPLGEPGGLCVRVRYE